MRIKKITSQNRRDFNAVYVCEHCGHEQTGYGYDDAYFHATVIPDMKCSECGKKSPGEYSAKSTKYPEGLQI